MTDDLRERMRNIRMDRTDTCFTDLLDAVQTRCRRQRLTTLAEPLDDAIRAERSFHLTAVDTLERLVAIKDDQIKTLNAMLDAALLRRDAARHVPAIPPANGHGHDLAAD